MEGEHPKADAFAFREDRHTGVFVCKRVADGAPILYVARDGDGDWQFLCGGQHEDGGEDSGLLICLEHLVARDPSLNDLADLCSGNHADRATPDDKWTITDEHEEFIRRSVEDPGWAIQLIPAGDREEEPAFAYTVGLYRSFRHPEIIVLGLDHSVMGRLLNICGDRIKAGETLPVDEAISEMLDNYPIKLRPVRDHASYEEHLGYAIWFYNGPEFPVLQLVWPDKKGRFPGEKGAAKSVSKLQPLLP